MSTAGNVVRSEALLNLEEMQEALRRVLQKEFDATWSEICAEIPISVSEMTITGAELDKLLDVLATKGPLCRVTALSWKIRSTAARKLSDLGRQ